jgi:hyaluronan synthase
MLRNTWLSTRIPALFYQPIENNYDTTATIVTPVYNEDPVLFRLAIESWIANAPERIIAVIDVTDTRCMTIAREYPEVEVIPIDIPGKRAALAAGVEAANTNLVALVDSDVIWEPDVLRKVKMPFADHNIGGVGTRQHMYPTDGRAAALWERIADIYLDIRYTDEIPATTRWGRASSCLSGRTAVYRTKLLQALRERFLNETFMGTQCMSGDDKRYTCLVLQSGYSTYVQLNAHIHSTFKHVRWSRNSLRSDLRALYEGWVWWSHPYLAIVLFMRSIAPFVRLANIVVLTLGIAQGRWKMVATMLFWRHVKTAVKILPHLWRVPRDWQILPLFVAVAFYMPLVKLYALLTIREHKWLTRNVAVVDGKVQRVAS